MSQRRGRDALTGSYRLDRPSLVVTGGPSFAREADDDDPPYVPPKQPLGFAPNLRECDRCPDDGCDLTCVWQPAEKEPLTWEGDGA
jgi:hypothetical protein